MSRPGWHKRVPGDGAFAASVEDWDACLDAAKGLAPDIPDEVWALTSSFGAGRDVGRIDALLVAGIARQVALWLERHAAEAP